MSAASDHPHPELELSHAALLEENRRLKASLAYLKEEVAELKCKLPLKVAHLKVEFYPVFAKAYSTGV